MSFNSQSSMTMTIGEKKYSVKYPNAGEIIDIENKKMFLSNDKYAEYASARVKTLAMAFNLDLIDTISHLTVLIPSLTKELAVQSILDIDPITAKHLVKAYKEQFYPWYSELVNAIHDHVMNDAATEEAGITTKED